MSFLNTETVNSTSVVRVYLATQEAGVSLGVINSNITNSDTTFSITPHNNFHIPLGVRIYKIEDELLIGYIYNNVFTLTDVWRGFYGSGANAHLTGSDIVLASLTDIVGDDVFLRRTPTDYQNDIPSIVIDRLGGTNTTQSYAVSDRLMFTIYGGKNLQGDIDEILPDLVFSALQAKTNKANNERTVVGTLGSIQMETGQQLIDDTMRPEWPSVKSFGTVNAV